MRLFAARSARVACPASSAIGRCRETSLLDVTASRDVGHATLIVMEQLTLHVTGMTCGGCENAVKRAVSRIDGVAAVNASHQDNRVVVEFDASRANRSEIEAAITKAGYHVAAA
jgi:copper chaperone